MLKQQCSNGKYMDCWEVIFNTHSKQMLTANKYGRAIVPVCWDQPQLATFFEPLLILNPLNNEAWPLPWRCLEAHKWGRHEKKNLICYASPLWCTHLHSSRARLKFAPAI